MDRSKLKAHLKIDEGFTDDDDLIDQKLAATKRQVDKTLWNYFTDDDLPTGSTTDIPIPPDVEEFVLRRAARLYEWVIENQEKDQTDQVGSAAITPEDPEGCGDWEPIMYLRDPLGLIGF